MAAMAHDVPDLSACLRSCSARTDNLSPPIVGSRRLPKSTPRQPSVHLPSRQHSVWLAGLTALSGLNWHPKEGKPNETLEMKTNAQHREIDPPRPPPPPGAKHASPAPPPLSFPSLGWHTKEFPEELVPRLCASCGCRRRRHDVEQQAPPCASVINLALHQR